MTTDQTTGASRRPLNGTKTHPLSDHAKGVLEVLAARPLLKHLINPGVRNRLAREELAAIVGDDLVITQAGLRRVLEFRQ
jgi:hypothetical protein